MIGGKSTITRSLNLPMVIKKVAEVTQFRRAADLQIVCDGSQAGLIAALQQQEDNY